MKAESIDLLNDTISYKLNLFSKVDPRVKLFFSITILGVVILSGNFYVPAMVLMFCISSLWTVLDKKGTVFIRFIPITLIATIIVISQIFLFGETILFSFNAPLFILNVYEEGISRGILISLKILSGFSLLTLLVTTTPINSLIYACKFFKISGTFLEILTISYRYIFILFEEMKIIRNAQKSRLGYTSLKKSVKSIGIICASLVLRSIDKSEKLYKSMKNRGYNGQKITTYYNEHNFNRFDLFISMLLSVIVIVLVFLNFGDAHHLLFICHQLKHLPKSF